MSNFWVTHGPRIFTIKIMITFNVWPIFKILGAICIQQQLWPRLTVAQIQVGQRVWLDICRRLPENLAAVLRGQIPERCSSGVQRHVQEPVAGGWLVWAIWLLVHIQRSSVGRRRLGSSSAESSQTNEIFRRFSEVEEKRVFHDRTQGRSNSKEAG